MSRVSRVEGLHYSGMRKRWIEAHGSPRLQMAVATSMAKGLIDLEYVAERLAQESRELKTTLYSLDTLQKLFDAADLDRLPPLEVMERLQEVQRRRTDCGLVVVRVEKSKYKAEWALAFKLSWANSPFFELLDMDAKPYVTDILPEGVF